MDGPALVFGSSGGIGRALVDTLKQRGGHSAVMGLSRSAGDFDFDTPATLDRLGERLSGIAPPALVLVATGLLHDGANAPEKSWRDLDAAWMARGFAVNAVGPALVAKAVVPLLPRDSRAVLAFLSARVGSISDNRLGGWHSYRASKAALNMLVRTMSLELARTHPQALCIALHPGTVDTAMSRPFQRGVAADRLFAPDRAAAQLLDVIAALTPADSGGCFDWAGAPVAP
jgi:NAD(P)-dependent dehydrogenase (short-subunit alcohol dehydrogenase family)